MFLPATPKELRELGWERLDVILVTGDSYIDSPFVGVSVIGQSLLRPDTAWESSPNPMWTPPTLPDSANRPFSGA